MKTIKNLFLASAAMLTIALTSCGDDDPITPMPNPGPEPTPTPTVNYIGYGCQFIIKDIKGDENTFSKILKDSMNHYCPELKEIEPGIYSASIVYEKDDTTAYNKLEQGFKSFKNWLSIYHKEAKTPIVSILSELKKGSKKNVSKDWVYNGQNAGSSQTIKVSYAVPALNKCTLTTDDPKNSNMNTVEFVNNWMHDSNSTSHIFSNKVIVNSKDEYQGARQGEAILLLDKDNQVRYGFTISADGESINLIKVGKDNLPKEEIVTYKVK